MAIVGIIESLMTLTLVDEITQTKGNGNREVFGQSIANIICGMFAGMGGCVTIGQAMINVQSGARSRISSFSAGFFLFVVMMGAYPLINIIPLAALTGVMFYVVLHTFEWKSLNIMFYSLLPLKFRSYFGDHAEYKVARTDAFCILLVTVVTLVSDLAVAVVCGIIFSSVCYAWNAGHSISVNSEILEGKKIYSVKGNLFFGSTVSFLEAFDALNDPDEVILRFESTISDMSGMDALNTLNQRYARAGKNIKIERLSDLASLKMLSKSKNLLTGEVRKVIEEVDMEKEFNPQIHYMMKSNDSDLVQRPQAKRIDKVSGWASKA
jgi:SulP family sulfate permease